MIQLKSTIIRKYDAIDNKQIKNEHENILNMISSGAYPLKFDFPLTLQFELTSKCNVYCKHCYNDSGNNTTKDEMTPEKWIQFSKYLVNHGGIFECILSGGEPLLLGDNLFKIMNILHDDGTNFLLITNGFLLDKETVKKLSIYNYRWLQVSIDGSTAEYHDNFRQRENSWKNAVNGAFMVSAAGIPLTIAHSVSPYNIDKIDDMCELAYNLGASSIILGEINLSGRTAKNQDLLLNDEQRTILLEKYEENVAKYTGKMLIQRSATPRISTKRYFNSPNTGLIVRPNGELRLDCMVPFVIGNVITDDFYDVWDRKAVDCWQHPKVKEYISKYDESERNKMMTNYIDHDIYI